MNDDPKRSTRSPFRWWFLFLLFELRAFWWCFWWGLAFDFNASAGRAGPVERWLERRAEAAVTAAESVHPEGDGERERDRSRGE